MPRVQVTLIGKGCRVDAAPWSDDWLTPIDNCEHYYKGCCSGGPDYCKQCHIDNDKPLGVHCYANYAAWLANPSAPVRGGLALGTKATNGTDEYCHQYTCGEAFDGYFSRQEDIGDNCEHYSKGCCGDGSDP